MAQFEVNLRDLYRVLRRRIRIFVVTPVLMGVATFFFTESPPPIYQAEALVKVTRSSTLAGLMVDLIKYSAYDDMATQVMVVTSQPVLQEVARRITGTDNSRLQEVVDQLKGQISAEQRGSSDVLAIKASAPSAKQAVLLANTTAEVYIQQSSAEKERRLNEMVQFIRRRVEETTQELSTIENQLSDLKRANAVSLALTPTQGVEIQEKRFQYDQKLKDARAALETLNEIQKSRNYNRLLEAAIQVDDPAVRSQADEIAKRAAALAELKNKRADFLRYQTEASPQVIQNSLQLEAEQARLEANLSNLLRRLNIFVAEYQRLNDTLARQQSELVRQPEVLTQMDGLQALAKQKQESLSNLRKQLQDAEIQNKEKVDDLAIVEEARRTAEIVPSSRQRMVLIGVILGILLGGIFAFVMESLDTSIGTIEDTERFLGSPVLGVVPHIQIEEVKGRMKRDAFSPTVSDADLEHFARLVTHFEPSSVAAEAYRTMRTQISSIMERQGAKTLMITSSALQEGKTTTACNLAIAMAQTGQRVLLIDADLRRPSIDKLFCIDKSPGLTEVLLGTRNLNECCRSIDELILGKFGLKAAHQTAGLEYLYLLPAGRSVDNPSELLHSVALNRLLADVRSSYDIALLDLSPILPVTDAAIVAPKVDGVILSYQIGRIGRDLLKRSKLRLEGLGANVWGIILNDIQAEIDYWGSEYQHYNYRYESNGTWVKPTLADRVKGAFRKGPAKRPAIRPEPESHQDSKES